MEKKKSLNISPDLKKKIIISVVGIAIAVIWAVLSLFFTMEFYSLFFASVVGCNILLVCLSAIITQCSDTIICGVFKIKLPYIMYLAISVCTMVAIMYCYSIFRYTMPWIVAIVFVLQVALALLCFKFIKEDEETKIPYIKRNLIKSIIISVVSSAVMDFIMILLVMIMLNFFRE